MMGDVYAGAERPDRAAETVRLVRVAGVLFLTASLFSIPGGLALDPQPALHEHLVAAAGVATSALLLLAPERWITRAWIYASLVLGTVLIALGVAIFSDDYAFFFVVTAIYAALALDERRELGAYLAVVLLALVTPLAYSDDLRDQLHHILVTLPVLVLSLLLVRYLRETLEQRERMYRGFADEAVALATRIRRSSRWGAPEPVPDDGSVALEQRLQELAASAGSAPGDE